MIMQKFEMWKTEKMRIAINVNRGELTTIEMHQQNFK